MSAAKSKYKKFAKLVYSGYSTVDAGVVAGIHKNKAVAGRLSYKLLKNKIVSAEMQRLEAAETYAIVMTKQEKLEKSAVLTRAVQEKLEDQLNPEEEGELDHKLLDSYIKLGKRDDVLQGHQIQAETNPQDKLDKAISDWVMESRDNNAQPNRMRVVQEEVIELEE